jgi:hypothetical protein
LRAELIEALLAKPEVDHVDGRPLFADEEHTLALRHVVGNQVRDRLRFAGARRPLNDVTAAGSRLRDRAGLRRVAGHDVVAVLQGRRRDVVGRQLAWRERKNRVESRVGRFLFQQRRIVAHQRHLAVTEVAQRHAAEVELPGVRVRFAFAFQRKEQPLLVRAGRRFGRRGGIGRALVGRQHPVPYSGRSFHDHPQPRARKANPLVEQP